jgi:lysophospholipase L1-like esterase
MKNWLPLIAIMGMLTSFTPKEITWVAIGDSFTYLNEHINETGSRVARGYLTRVANKMPNVHYINHGYNGWTAGGIASSINKLGLQKADVYSVLLGTNDWWQGHIIGSLADYQNNTGDSTFYGSLRIITSKLKNLNPHATIILITPMQRADFVYVADMKNNAWGSYKEKAGQTLAGFAEAIIAICKYEHFKLADLYHESSMKIESLVKYKRVKDPQTGVYKNYTYPAYTTIPFNPETDQYPYPLDAINITYDGLHPSDKGNEMIAQLLVKILKKI